MSSEWRTQKISSLGEFDRGKSKHRPRDAAHLYGGLYPFIQTGDITNSGGRITTFRQTYSDAGLAQSRLWPAGTLAITIAANIAETALLTFPACFPDSVVGFTADTAKADVRFIEYLFQAMRKQVKSHAYGSAQENINLEVLRKLEFPIPSLETQTKIADYLTILDDRISLLRETNTTLEAIAQALFKSWFVDFDPVHAKMQGRAPEGMDEATAALFPDSFEESELGPVPKGWESSTLGKSFELTMGQSPPGDTYNQTENGLPFYQGRTDFGFRFPAKRIYCNAPTRLAEISDTLVSVRAPVGDVNMAIERCCIGRGVAAVRHQSGCVGYTFYAMKNLGTHFKNFDTEGTIFGSINKKDFEALPVVVPSEGVLFAFDEISKATDGSIEINEQKIRALVEIRDTLLPRLISGQLRVNSIAEVVES